jgi:hypothetical protein
LDYFADFTEWHALGAWIPRRPVYGTSDRVKPHRP